MTTEFKSHLNDRELTKAVACLANAQGGTLLLGVDDDGQVVGARDRPGGHRDPVRVAAYVQNSTDPPLGVEARLEDIEGRAVFRIDVPRATPGPVATKDGYYTKRVLDTLGQPQCVPMSPQEIVSLGMLTRGQDYAAAAATGATHADLDPAEFDRYRRLCSLTGDSTASLQDEDILRALGLVPIGSPLSLGAILLFGRPAAISRWVPNAEFVFQDLRKGESAANDRIVGPLLRVSETLQALIDARNSVTELMAGIHRVEVSLIPSVTRREAVANAIVHRDYSALGPTRVQIDDAEFVVSSPEGLPPGVTIQNILNESRPRSPILADAFKRAGLVERKGKGVNEMFEQQLRAGRDAPSYARSTTNSVMVSVPLGTADLDLVRFLLTFENEQQRPLGLDQLRVMHEIKEMGSATPGELAVSLSMLPAVARNTSTQLVEMGILEARGVGRSRRLHLTPRFYDLAQDRSAYVRVKGADPIQQQRMIRDYVDAYGSITRSQAAGLCQLSPTQARAVLKRMVDRDELRLVGERRGAKYTRP
ncbi:DNA glycosylase AlkZ-like family protein [Mobilicoccus massiliensis]|uniref:DNA glycosylase AlkZ-like family protein n=1 Tax=Mobilicoccus massiliensis TaxID=1522310 RepID=UPI001FE6B8D2|nr:crosslink repair DNA glycosylase YcaQ family protein [Mobilicoccus massiliensis]